MAEINIAGQDLDSIDSTAVIETLKSVGLGLRVMSDPSVQSRLVNIFRQGRSISWRKVRGFRHTMLDDSDIGATRHTRAAVDGLISGLAGTGAVYVSGGAEHQGPPGGGPVAAIARQWRSRGVKTISQMQLFSIVVP
jgi:cyanuric acid amidohydrolase